METSLFWWQAPHNAEVMGVTLWWTLSWSNSIHFSAIPVLFLGPTSHPHLVQSPWRQAWFTAPPQHSLSIKLPGLLDPHDFYCITLHYSPIPDAALHNIWWYRICQEVEIRNIELDWTLWRWSVFTDSLPWPELGALDIIEMHIKSWCFGILPPRLMGIFFCASKWCK